MNNEKMNQIIDEAYKNYSNSHWTPPSNPNGKLLSDQLWSLTPQLHNRDTFIKEIKTNPMFSKRWGLKIEERELSLLERYELMKKLDNWVSVHYKEPKTMEYMDSQNIPTKLLTITYNNETIEVYE